MRKMLIFSLLWLIGLGAVEPLALYLTWVGDPARSMVVQWHTGAEDGATEVAYQRKGEAGWQRQGGESWMVAGIGSRVHRVELGGLRPDTEYAFKMGEKVYRFKTMPKELSREVKFVVGGDLFHETEENFEKMNRVVARQNPDFVVMGGDLAYTRNVKNAETSKEWQKGRWDRFFQDCQNQLVTADGRMIPLVIVVGNHDVKRFDPADMFYEIFSFPVKNVAYRALDFGSYLRLILLDSAHTYPVEGEQTAWLEGALKEKEEMLYTFPIYHVAGFPAYYPFNQETSSKIRQYWVPLFEKMGIRLVFEHHNHVYKRTHPIKGNAVNPGGVVYVGDGSWGVNPRVPRVEGKWYLAEVKGINAVFVVTLNGASASIQAISNDGGKVDEVQNIPSKAAAKSLQLAD